MNLPARDMEDRVGFVKFPLQRLDSMGRRNDKQLDLTVLRFELQFFHHRQSGVCSCTYHQ